jgi:hypothetical protein
MATPPPFIRTWGEAIKHLKGWTEGGAILVPRSPDDQTTPVAYQYGDLQFAQTCANHPGVALLAVPSTDYLVVRTKDGSVRVYHRESGGFTTLSEPQATAVKSGSYKVVDHFLLIRRTDQGKNQVQIINLAPLTNGAPPTWLIKLLNWSDETQTETDGPVIDVDVVSTALVVTRSGDCTIVVDDEGKERVASTFTPGKLVGRARKASRDDVFLCTISLTGPFFLGVCHSPSEGLIRTVRVNVKDPFNANVDPLRTAILKTTRNSTAKQVLSTSNGAIITYESPEKGIGPVYTIIWKSEGNSVTCWDTLTKQPHTLIGRPVHLLVDPSSQDRNAMMLAVDGPHLKLFVLYGATARMRLVHRCDYLPLSYPHGAMFVPRYVNPRHRVEADAQYSAPVVAMLLQRLCVVSDLFEVAKKEIPAVQDAPRIVKLRESLTDSLAAFKQLRTKHQGAIHRYETLLVSAEENAARRAHELARAANVQEVAREKRNRRLQSDCDRIKNQLVKTDAEKDKVQKELNTQRTETTTLQKKMEQLRRAWFAEKESRDRDDELKSKHATKLAEVHSTHAATLAEVRSTHAAELAKVQAELAEARTRQVTVRVTPTPPPDHQEAPSKYVETLKLEIARLTQVCGDKQGLVAYYESLLYTGIVDPMFQTPLPQLLQQVRNLNQFKRDNAELYAKNQELRQQVEKLQSK